MAFNVFFKKGRLIWDEYIPSTLTNDSLVPKVSFDQGYSWMSLDTQVENLRNDYNVYGGSIKDIGNGFKQIDISFTFTPTSIPKIADYALEPDSAYGLNPGTYYFAVGCLNYDTPCMNEFSGSNYYATGYFTEPISKLIKIVIESKSKVHLFVNYPEYTRGLCIYYGQESSGTINLKLYHVTNLVQLLNNSISADSSATIVFKNKYPFPDNGIVKIENEYIGYTTCSWDSSTSQWKLIGLTRGLYNTTPTTHINPTGENIPIYLAMYENGGLYGEIPDRIYARPELDSDLVQYLNFDSSTPLDLVDNTRQITEIGEVNYSSTWTMLSSSLKLSGRGYINSNYNLTNNIVDQGSIHFYISFESFVDNETIDPYIFGTADGTGLWMRISRITNKPYFGVGDVTIVGSEDFRVPSLTKNNYDRIGLAWRLNSDGFMEFDFAINGYSFITESTRIPKFSSNEINRFTPGILLIGGTSLSPNTSFNGYIDDWRVYNSALSLEEFNSIHTYMMSRPNIYCGKIIINNGFKDLSGANVSLQDYEPLIDTVINTSVNGGRDFGIYYDDWLIEKLLTDHTILSGERITYPIESDTIQLRFNMHGYDPSNTTSGYYSPILKNISLIVSEESLG